MRIAELVGRKFFQDADTLCRPSGAVEGEGVGDGGGAVVWRLFVGLLREETAGGGVGIEEQGETGGIGGEADLFEESFGAAAPP